KVYEAEVQKKSNSNSQDMAFISSLKNSSTEDGNTVKEGVGYNAVPPPAADLYLSPKKDLSWTGLP
nr:hypothetical protein [Tanacetum cinerariifolium]